MNMYYDNPEEFLERTMDRFQELVEISKTSPYNDVSITPDAVEFVRSLLPELVELSCECRRRLRLGMNDIDMKLHIFFGEPNGHALWSILHNGRLGVDKFATGRKAKVLEAKKKNDIGKIVEELSETIRNHNFEDGVESWNKN